MKEKIKEYSLLVWLTLSAFLFIVNGFFLLILPQFLWDGFHLVEIFLFVIISLVFSFNFTLKFYKKSLVETNK